VQSICRRSRGEGCSAEEDQEAAEEGQEGGEEGQGGEAADEAAAGFGVNRGNSPVGRAFIRIAPEGGPCNIFKAIQL